MSFTVISASCHKWGVLRWFWLKSWSIATASVVPILDDEILISVTCFLQYTPCVIYICVYFFILHIPIVSTSSLPSLSSTPINTKLNRMMKPVEPHWVGAAPLSTTMVGRTIQGWKTTRILKSDQSNSRPNQNLKQPIIQKLCCKFDTFTKSHLVKLLWFRWIIPINARCIIKANQSQIKPNQNPIKMKSKANLTK